MSLLAMMVIAWIPVGDAMEIKIVTAVKMKEDAWETNRRKRKRTMKRKKRKKKMWLMEPVQRRMNFPVTMVIASAKRGDAMAKEIVSMMKMKLIVSAAVEVAAKVVLPVEVVS